MGLVALPPLDLMSSAAMNRGRGRRPFAGDDGDFAISLRERTSAAQAGKVAGPPEHRGWRRADHPGRGHARGRAGDRETLANERPAEETLADDTPGAVALLALGATDPVPITPVEETGAPPGGAPDTVVAAGPLSAEAATSLPVDAPDSAPVPSSGETASGDSPATAKLGPEPPLETATEQTGEPADAPSEPGMAIEPDPAPLDASKVDAASTGEAPPTGAEPTTSVVRTVGNANESGTTAEPNVWQAPDRPATPRASEQGVAHAASNSAVAALREAPVEAPAIDAAPAPQPVDVPEPVQQVAQVVVDSIEQGGGEARLHLKPAELGEVLIRVRIEGAEVRVQVHAERPEAMQLLREHRLDLTNLLGDRGLDLSELYVGLGGREPGDSLATPDDRLANRANGSSDFAGLLGIDPEPSIDQHNRLRAAYNPDGALVYRV